MLAASLPDLDGITYILGREAYWSTHHIIGHNILYGILLCGILAAFSRHRIKVFFLYLGLFHLHLVMDLFGSGPGWTISYLWPFNGHGFEINYCWPLYSWQNITAGILFLLWTLFIIRQKKRTPLEIIMPSLDHQIVDFFNKKPEEKNNAAQSSQTDS
jgi:hypothetical protein